MDRIPPNTRETEREQQTNVTEAVNNLPNQGKNRPLSEEVEPQGSQRTGRKSSNAPETETEREHDTAEKSRARLHEVDKSGGSVQR